MGKKITKERTEGQGEKISHKHVCVYKEIVNKAVGSGLVVTLN